MTKDTRPDHKIQAQRLHSANVLAFENSRVQTWETQQRLPQVTPLAYAFLVSLLDCSTVDIVTWLLWHSCHRTTK